MKYIMIKTTVGELEVIFPIIFPNNLVHAEISKAILSTFPEEYKAYTSSAGDCLVRGDCSGCSTSLELTSDELDTRIINSNDYLHGLG